MPWYWVLGWYKKHTLKFSKTVCVFWSVFPTIPTVLSPDEDLRLGSRLSPRRYKREKEKKRMKRDRNETEEEVKKNQNRIKNITFCRGCMELLVLVKTIFFLKKNPWRNLTTRWRGHNVRKTAKWLSDGACLQMYGHKLYIEAWLAVLNRILPIRF